MAGLALLLYLGTPEAVFGQINPVERRLLEFGYNHPLSGAGPTAGYLFLYLNKPDVLREDATLRLAVAPVYVDGEYGIGGALGRHTDLGIGLAGGGFAQNHAEVRRGRHFPDESFYGHSGQASLSAYHLFNPGGRIPLMAVLRQTVQYSAFQPDKRTAAGFTLPPDHVTSATRAGLRFGGETPTMPPSDALEVSIWYEGRFRDRGAAYGFEADRPLRRATRLLWLKTVFVHVRPGSGRRAGLGLSAGASDGADRLNGYGLGGFLPLSSDFPRDIPGYFHRELTARRFALFSGQYGVPVDREKRFLVNLFAASALVSDVPGLESREAFHSGVGLGIQYDSPSHAWNILLDYGYGIDALRSSGRGAHSISLTLQYDLLAKEQPVQPKPLKPLPAFKR